MRLKILALVSNKYLSLLRCASDAPQKPATSIFRAQESQSLFYQEHTVYINLQFMSSSQIQRLLSRPIKQVVKL